MSIKKELKSSVQTLPNENLFAGGIVIDATGNQDFMGWTANRLFQKM